MRVDQKAAFLYFVYPFRFDSSTFTARSHAAAAAELPGAHGPQAVWQLAPLNQNDEMLPQVADYLNPADPQMATAWIWKLSDQLQEVYGLADRAEWYLRHRDRTIPFSLGKVGAKDFAFELALFQNGVGFVVTQAMPNSADPADWFDFLHYFRFFRGHRQVQITAQRSCGHDRQANQRLYQEFFPAPAGGAGSHLGLVLDSLLKTLQLPDEGQPWWQDVFVPGQLLPFAGLYLDDVPPEEVMLQVYQARNFFHMQQELHPTAADLAAEQTGLIEYAEHQWMLFSLEGGGFLATDAPKKTEFARVEMPRHLRSVYFMIFLLALHERFALMVLSQEVASRWPGGEPVSDTAREVAFERIRTRLLTFAARSYFAQVMQKEHHHRCFQRWEEVFQIPRMYREVRDEIQDLYECLALQRQQRLQEFEEAQQQRSARLERLITTLAAVIGVPALALTFLQAASATSYRIAVWTAVVTLVLGLLFIVAARWLTTILADLPSAKPRRKVP
jgi:hypothetical protein